MARPATTWVRSTSIRLDLVFADQRDGLGEEIEFDGDTLLGADVLRHGGEAAQQVNRFAKAGLEDRVFGLFGQVARIDVRRGAFEFAQFAKLLGGHHDLVRSAPAEDHDSLYPRGVQRVERMGDDVAALELVRGLGEDSRHVERDIAHADHHCGRARQVGLEVGELRMSVVPANERGAAEHVAEGGAGNAEVAVARRAGRQHHRVVQLAQLGNGHIAADGDIADEPHVVAQRGLLVAPRHRLDRLVVRRHPGADQPIGHRQQVEDVDPHLIAELLLRRFGGVIPGGP